MDNNKKALLVMDMIDLYVYGSQPFVNVDGREKQISNIKNVIELARKRNPNHLHKIAF